MHFEIARSVSLPVWVGTALAVPPSSACRFPARATPRFARNSAVRSLYHRCHPEEAQAFVHESLPTKDLCTIWRTSTRPLLLALDVILTARFRFAKQDGTQRRIYSISKLHDSFLPVW